MTNSSDIKQGEQLKQGAIHNMESDNEGSGGGSSGSGSGLTPPQSCESCSDTVITDQKLCVPSNYKLKEGEYMYDREGSASTASLSTYIHLLSASNVYRTFFAYTQVIQHDSSRCFTSFSKYKKCNRFIDVPCIEPTRVKVRHPTEDHDYIHANWVDGYRETKKFIVTQAPLPKTINQFWRMIWQEKSTVVVCMIQMYDAKAPESTFRYIPVKSKETYTAGDIVVEHCGTRTIRDTYDATVLKVRHNGQERKILHFCYFAWAEKGSPNKPTELLNMIADLNYNRELLRAEAEKAGWLNKIELNPAVIHCLAGSGRSCTLVALDICCRKLDDTYSRPTGPMADAEDVTLRLRTQRAMAIQKPEQYLYLHLALLEYAVRMGYVPSDNYPEVDLEGYLHYKHSNYSTMSHKSAAASNSGTSVAAKSDEEN